MIGRRAILALPFAVAACSRASRPPVSSDVRVARIKLDASAAKGGPKQATVLAPASGGPWPVLVALPGRGEVVRGADAAADGWLKDYQLDRAITAVGRGVTKDDFDGQISDARLRELRDQHARSPYRGLVVVCPDIGDILAGERKLDACDAWGRALVDHVLPRIRSEWTTTDAFGIDGVSLGGRAALLVGLAHPRVFSSVGSLQAAVRANEIDALAERAKAYKAARPDGVIRLLSSSGDYFRPTLAELSTAMKRAGTEHVHIEVEGPHDYSFNRGPGGIEMLLFHDAKLRAR